MKLNTDRLAMLPRDRAAAVAHQVLNPISTLTPEEQMAGAAVLFYVLCHRNGLTGADMHSMAERMIRPQPFHRKGNVQIEALQDFAGFTHPTT